MSILTIIILILLIVGYFYISKHYKMPKIGAMTCVTGGVKSGKSTFSFALAYKAYKRNVRGVKIRNFFRTLFRVDFQEEIPLFYTTIPVACEHVLLTKDLLMRKERFAYKSVIWIDEASLLADSQYCKDLEINDNLMFFNKLIAHETKGGLVVYNTQSVADLHYSVKRCLSEVFYVHDTFKWLPFFLVCTVREERYSEDLSVQSTYQDDLEETLKRVIIPKKVWKMFDCYCYSKLTDKLAVNTNVTKAEDLKAKKLLSFNPRHELEVDDLEDKEVIKNCVQCDTCAWKFNIAGCECCGCAVSKLNADGTCNSYEEKKEVPHEKEDD